MSVSSSPRHRLRPARLAAPPSNYGGGVGGSEADPESPADPMSPFSPFADNDKPADNASRRKSSVKAFISTKSRQAQEKLRDPESKRVFVGLLGACCVFLALLFVTSLGSGQANPAADKPGLQEEVLALRERLETLEKRLGEDEKQQHMEEAVAHSTESWLNAKPRILGQITDLMSKLEHTEVTAKQALTLSNKALTDLGKVQAQLGGLETGLSRVAATQTANPTPKKAKATEKVNSIT